MILSKVSLNIKQYTCRPCQEILSLNANKYCMKQETWRPDSLVENHMCIIRWYVHLNHKLCLSVNSRMSLERFILFEADITEFYFLTFHVFDGYMIEYFINCMFLDNSFTSLKQARNGDREREGLMAGILDLWSVPSVYY